MVHTNISLITPALALTFGNWSCCVWFWDFIKSKLALFPGKSEQPLSVFPVSLHVLNR